MPDEKILLIQLFSNGDCLYATAVARQIKTDLPGCRLTWAISASCKHILAGNPYVDEIMEVSSVSKNDERAFRRFVAKARASAEWNRVVVTHIMGDNQANYDGCIRSAIFRGYQFPLHGDVQPVLRLSEAEKDTARDFAQRHRLQAYRWVILFEFAPLSGQSAITPIESLQIAEKLAGHDTAVILSSANRVIHDHPAIIDGSVLSIRETAALTHHCNFLIGCSSGITWLTTSDGARELPMVQLLNPHTNWINPVSRDFARFRIDADGLIELYHFDVPAVATCVQKALADFGAAREEYHQSVPVHFRTTRNIVYNLLCYWRFSAIGHHIRINRQLYGDRPAFYAEVLAGFLILPFRLIGNFLRKKVLR